MRVKSNAELERDMAQSYGIQIYQSLKSTLSHDFFVSSSCGRGRRSSLPLTIDISRHWADKVVVRSTYCMKIHFRVWARDGGYGGQGSSGMRGVVSWD